MRMQAGVVTMGKKQNKTINRAAMRPSHTNPIDEWIKENVLNVCKRILFSNKRECNSGICRILELKNILCEVTGKQTLHVLSSMCVLAMNS